jgi:hypothetical protein
MCFALAGVAVLIIIISHIVAFRKRSAKKSAAKADKQATALNEQALIEQLETALREDQLAPMEAALNVGLRRVRELKLSSNSRAALLRDELELRVAEKRVEELRKRNQTRSKS